MATTTHILPIYTRISQKILRKPMHGRAREGTEIVEGLDRFWLVLRCPMHAWSWPRANKEERFDGFDAHQTCNKCTSQRMFDTRDWHPGPLYRRHREHPE